MHVKSEGIMDNVYGHASDCLTWNADSKAHQCRIPCNRLFHTDWAAKAGSPLRRSALVVSRRRRATASCTVGVSNSVMESRNSLHTAHAALSMHELAA